MIKQLQTSRTCAACGQKKPLVAFLALAGGDGHTYGDICATCRGSGKTIQKTKEEHGENSGDNTRLQIDTKAKIQIERDKKEQAKETTQQDHEEKVKKATSKDEKDSAAQQREKEEKKFREEFLELKKQAANKTATNEPRSENTRENQATQAQGFYQEKARATGEFNNKVSGEQLGKKTTGLSVEYINRYVAATGRSAESLFGRLLGQYLKTHIDAHQKKHGSSHPGAAKPQTKNKGAPAEAGQSITEDNTAVEFVRNNFKKR